VVSALGQLLADSQARHTRSARFSRLISPNIKQQAFDRLGTRLTNISASIAQDQISKKGDD
jgi:hypothetical protein